jgi:DNA repair and recombination protein RAD52
MAGAFSGHIIDSFYSNTRTINRNCGPFNQSMASTPSPQSIHGAMSFAPQMHGTQPSFSFNSEQPSFLDISEATAVKIAQLQTKLNQKLGPEYISQRPGPGGGPKLTYAEGWKMINLANEVFGFNGWSSSVVSLTVDFIDCNEESKRYSVGVTAIVRVMLRDGVFHEDIGYGILENSKSKGGALDKVCPSYHIQSFLKSYRFRSARRRQSPMVLNVPYEILGTCLETVFTINPTHKKSSR